MTVEHAGNSPSKHMFAILAATMCVHFLQQLRNCSMEYADNLLCMCTLDCSEARSHCMSCDTHLCASPLELRYTAKIYTVLKPGCHHLMQKRIMHDWRLPNEALSATPSMHLLPPCDAVAHRASHGEMPIRSCCTVPPQQASPTGIRVLCGHELL